ncbi:DUF2829 domain-containing protein [Xenorhabdus sp. 12]|uniref:DUF2829 domain-containing protein n=1 Tax=Xenorhabdus santafensis TaxID=2582833 RepID=A0ABU4SEM8_9GAMM|nr:MW1434 family type I TA system toxin [Xenorhabdus sp. 12]MDX7989249.1 DUF2829 domain-containing protein [Xenorhabdus sp. 12]
MSEVNKLDDKQCPFDPDLYHYKQQIDIEVDNVAPDGSLPWALMQVYVGKVLSRNQWNSNEYIQLSAKNDGSEPIHIEKHDQQSFPFPWEPTPEDLMACDWKLVKTEDCMLSFDLTVGTKESDYFNNTGWGYILGGMVGWPNTVGALNINENNTTDIARITGFNWGKNNIFYINLSTKQDTESYQNIGLLFQNKELQVIVNNKSYNLGKAYLGHHENGGPYDYEFSYQNSEAQKLGDLLIQNVGKTLHFCLNWK